MSSLTSLFNHVQHHAMCNVCKIGSRITKKARSCSWCQPHKSRSTLLVFQDYGRGLSSCHPADCHLLLQGLWQLCAACAHFCAGLLLFQSWQSPSPGGGSPLTVQGVPPQQVRVMAIHFVGRFFSRNPRYLGLGVRSPGSPAHAQQVCFRSAILAPSNLSWVMS